jgi:hypothetical protein
MKKGFERRRFHYRTQWPKTGLFCPIGKTMSQPSVRISAVNARPMSFKTVDGIIARIGFATFEDAAERLCKQLNTKYGGYIRVWVGEKGLWSEYVIGRRI